MNSIWMHVVFLKEVAEVDCITVAYNLAIREKSRTANHSARAVHVNRAVSRSALLLGYYRWLTILS